MGLLQLQKCAGSGDAAGVQELLDGGTDPDERDHRGRTALHAAAAADSYETAELLIKAGANVTTVANNHSNALSFAKSPEMRQLLARAWPPDHPAYVHALAAANLADELVEQVAGGRDLNNRWHGRTPLELASAADALETVEILLEAGVNPVEAGAQPCASIIGSESSFMRTLLARAWPKDDPSYLHALAASNLAPELSVALEDGADPDVRVCNNTALMFAAFFDSMSAAKTLLAGGADVTVANEDGRTALDIANSPAMKKLLARAWPARTRGRLHALVRANLAREVAQELAAGADPDAPWGRTERTPLMAAVSADALEAAAVLLKGGASVVQSDAGKCTALDYAGSLPVRLRRGICNMDVNNTEMKQLLARAWPKEHPGRLHALAKADLVEEIREELTTGANVDGIWAGRTPLMDAARSGAGAATEVLLEAGARSDIRDRSGVTALEMTRKESVRDKILAHK